ncbi:MAG: hypothetical protein IJT38_03575 [Clostridia bacterium]|nr:hypothetical protein [Clostridia bacterium]
MSKKAKKSFVLKHFKTRFAKPDAFAAENGITEDEPKSDVVREAENIIDAYLKKMGYDGMTYERHSRKGGVILGLSVVLGVITAIFLIVRIA